MSSRRALISFTALLALTACDPLFSTQYRQPLAPLAGDPCVEAALRSSRLISMVEREVQAHEILETVRAQCAPDVPSTITCKGVGGIVGQRGACSTRA